MSGVVGVGVVLLDPFSDLRTKEVVDDTVPLLFVMRK